MSEINLSDITIRKYKEEDVKYLMDFSEEHGWDLSTYDHMAYSRIDPDYLLVAVDRSDEPVGFCGGSLHPENIIYLGNFIVRKDLRGKGIGKLLWKSILERAEGKNMVLDGGKRMEDWYFTHGFPIKSFKVGYYNFTVTNDMKKDRKSNYNIVNFSEDMWPALMEYDKQVYPHFDRKEILRAWFTGEYVRVIVALDGEKIVGYGSIIRKPSSSKEYSLRNIFGDSEDVIEAILHEMVSGLPEGTFIRFWLLEGKPVPKYIENYFKVDETARRMYSKANIETNTDKMWFVTAHIL